MRKLVAAVLLFLVISAAWAQGSDDVSDDTSDTSDRFDSAASDSVDAADSEPTPTPAPAPEPTPPPPAREAVPKITVGGLKAVVYSADGRRAASREGDLGDVLFKGDKLGTGQSVEVSFTPQLSGSSSTKPAQAMLMAVSKAAGGLSAYAVAKGKKDGSLTLTLSTSALEKQIANVGGELELTLLLGDPSVPLGVSSGLGTIELPEAASGAAPKPRLLTAKHQPLNNIKPAIVHTFRPPAKRAPAIVSLTATGLALAPLGALIVYLGMLGVNLKGLPSGAANLWVLLFHGGIAAMLGLYLLFWLKLNLAQTIPMALALGVFTAGTGYYALSALSDARLAAEKSASPAAMVKKTN